MTPAARERRNTAAWFRAIGWSDDMIQPVMAAAAARMRRSLSGTPRAA